MADAIEDEERDELADERETIGSEVLARRRHPDWSAYDNRPIVFVDRNDGDVALSVVAHVLSGNDPPELFEYGDTVARIGTARERRRQPSTSCSCRSIEMGCVTGWSGSLDRFDAPATGDRARRATAPDVLDLTLARLRDVLPLGPLPHRERLHPRRRHGVHQPPATTRSVKRSCPPSSPVWLSPTFRPPRRSPPPSP